MPGNLEAAGIISVSCKLKLEVAGIDSRVTDSLVDDMLIPLCVGVGISTFVPIVSGMFSE